MATETLFKQLSVGDTFAFLSPRMPGRGLPDGIFKKTSARDAEHTNYEYAKLRPSPLAHVMKIDLDDEEGQEGEDRS